MKLAPNIVINNRYNLTRQIAVGGMGEMWQAKDTTLGRIVAIKAMREEHAGNEDFLHRLRIEARNNAILTHPNIVALHDYHEEASIGFIIMEFVEGKSLGQILQETPIMPLVELLPILAQVAKGLSFAHKSGIIHRDIKPANILVSPDGLVKVVDFGVSKAMNQTNMTATGMVVGTAQYLSPEQAIGDEASASSDLYALGVIAYEASCGKRPFGGKNAVDIAIAQVNSPVPPMPDDTNPEFQKLVMSLLEKSTKNRPVDANRVAKELEKIYSSLIKDEAVEQKASSKAKVSKTREQRAVHRNTVKPNSKVTASAMSKAETGPEILPLDFEQSKSYSNALNGDPNSKAANFAPSLSSNLPPNLAVPSINTSKHKQGRFHTARTASHSSAAKSSANRPARLVSSSSSPGEGPAIKPGKKRGSIMDMSIFLLSLLFIAIVALLIFIIITVTTYGTHNSEAGFNGAVAKWPITQFN